MTTRPHVAELPVHALDEAWMIREPDTEHSLVHWIVMDPGRHPDWDTALCGVHLFTPSSQIYTLESQAQHPLRVGELCAPCMALMGKLRGDADRTDPGHRRRNKARRPRDTEHGDG